MKKLFTLAVVLIATLSFSGCSEVSTSSGSNGNEDSSTIPMQTSTFPILDDDQQYRLDRLLESYGDSDQVLNTVAACVSISYDDINENWWDLSARNYAMAVIQDCVEEADPALSCREADDDTGPFCGPSDKRTGFSIAAIAGAMMGIG